MTTSGPNLPNADAEATPAGSLRLDLISGYFLACCRVVAWAGVSAYVFRRIDATAFGLLALLRSTIGLLSYTSLGIGPAMIQALAHVRRTPGVVPPTDSVPSINPLPVVGPVRVKTKRASGPESGLEAAATPALPIPAEPIDKPDGPLALQYAPVDLERQEHQATARITPEQRVYASGAAVVGPLVLIAIVLAFVVGTSIPELFAVPPNQITSARGAAIILGIGLALRMASEPISAAFAVRGRLATDNFILAGAEVFALIAVLVIRPGGLAGIAAAWAGAAFLISVVRKMVHQSVSPDLTENANARDYVVIRNILTVGLLITVSQAADFLYAPSASIVVNYLLGPTQVAAYATVVQIDAALLLVVAGVAAALYPRAALAFAANDMHRLRTIYVRGTLLSAAALTAAAVVVCLVAEPVLELWLEVPQRSSFDILPLVLVHTVVGGSSGVGRSILLGMGKTGLLTVTALLGGVMNVVLGAILAGSMGLGLKGIVLATIIVVVARCAIWMPWYVLRVTATEKRRDGETK